MAKPLQTIKTKQLEGDVRQIEYIYHLDNTDVPLVLWLPSNSQPQPKVLIAMAHGGSLHKKTEDIRVRAHRFAKDYGWASFALDAPGHGDRISRHEALKNMEATKARVLGQPDAPSFSLEDKITYLDDLAATAVPEWQAVLTELLASSQLAEQVSIGFWGISMGTSIGIPLLATDSRYQCAVLGLSELLPGHVSFGYSASQITVPLRLIFQWDDPIRDRQNGIRLFEALGSQEKSMHINPGGHSDFPTPEADSWDDFYRRLLT